MTSNSTTEYVNETKEEKAVTGQETLLIPDELWDELFEQAHNAFPPEQKIRAVVAYFNTGTIVSAAKETGINRNTIQAWSAKPWWEKLKRHLQRVTDERIIEAQQRTAFKAIQKLEELVDKGEPVYDKDGNPVKDESGEQRRKPLSARDLAIYGHAVPLDKRAIVSGNRPTKTGNSAVDALRELRTMLHEIGAAKMTETIEQ